jgi:threonine dehydratase
MTEMNWGENIQQASARIEGHVERTVLVESSELSRRLGVRVMLKLENQQVTGSFKARGAMNKLLCLSADERSSGVIAASSGNHGAAVAYGAKRLGCSATIYVPKYAADIKKEAIRALGATVCVAGEDCVETEAIARAASERLGAPYIPPYNDPDVMAGQGTVAVEMLQECPELDAIFVALGGGGLIGGMGLFAKSIASNIAMIACSPVQSPALHRCMEVGKTIDVPCFETLSDATAGGVEEGSITVDVCTQVVDESLLISEEHIAESMRSLWQAEELVVEGAAGVAMAGAEHLSDRFKGKTIGIVVCGGNIGVETRQRVLGF